MGNTSGLQGTISPYVSGEAYLATGQKKYAIDEVIHDLDIDRTPFIHLLNKLGKESVDQMKFEHMTDERRADWITPSAVGGAWALGAASTGNLTVSTDEVWLFAAEDVILVPGVSSEPVYVTSVDQATGVVTCRTVTGANIDFSGVGSVIDQIFLMGQSFEEGSGKGTIKSQKVSDHYNYIQIFQRPAGVTTTSQHIAYRGGDIFDRQKKINAIEHEFDIEKTFFFGKKKYVTQGYQNGVYGQWFTGGLREAMSTNVVDAGGALTKTEFMDWVKSVTEYGDETLIFCGGTILEALNTWYEDKLKIMQNQDTFGLKILKVQTIYGDQVMLTPHRYLLKNDFAGMAFAVDVRDVKYEYLQGLDTHMVTGIQQPDLKQRIDEIRTWAGLKIRNEKKHGLLYGVTSIST
jgi:hypothetical protein